MLDIAPHQQLSLRHPLVANMHHPRQSSETIWSFVARSLPHTARPVKEHHYVYVEDTTPRSLPHTARPVKEHHYMYVEVPASHSTSGQRAPLRVCWGHHSKVPASHSTSGQRAPLRVCWGPCLTQHVRSKSTTTCMLRTPLQGPCLTQHVRSKTTTTCMLRSLPHTARPVKEHHYVYVEVPASHSTSGQRAPLHVCWGHHSIEIHYNIHLMKGHIILFISLFKWIELNDANWNMFLFWVSLSPLQRRPVDTHTERFIIIIIIIQVKWEDRNDATLVLQFAHFCVNLNVLFITCVVCIIYLCIN